MRAVLVVLFLLVAARPSDACVQLAEANKLLGWSADGKLALAVRVDDKGKLAHAEILPTRYEGWKFLVMQEEANTIRVMKVAVKTCDVLEAPLHAQVKGKLTEKSLMDLAVVKAMKLVTPPTDDGEASKLTAAFVPAKRYAEHQVEIKGGTKVVATLPVPVWCVGSCLRDEDWKNWGVTITSVATAGDRTLYVVRMRNVCNGGNDKEMWIDRVIAAPGTEKRPPRSRCRGSG